MPIGIEPSTTAQPNLQSGSARQPGPEQPADDREHDPAELVAQVDQRRQHRAGLDDRGERGDVGGVDW